VLAFLQEKGFGAPYYSTWVDLVGLSRMREFSTFTGLNPCIITAEPWVLVYHLISTSITEKGLQVVWPSTIQTIRGFESWAPAYRGSVVIVDTCLLPG